MRCPLNIKDITLILHNLLEFTPIVHLLLHQLNNNNHTKINLSSYSAVNLIRLK